jgi:hypothetical protein
MTKNSQVNPLSSVLTVSTIKDTEKPRLDSNPAGANQKSGESPDFGLDNHKSTAIRPEVKAKRDELPQVRRINQQGR